MVVLAHIKEQSRLSLGSYGRPRMTEELKEVGVDVGHRRVGRLMRENGIAVERTRKFKATTDSDHKFNIAPNLLNRDFSAAGPNQKWAGDISYIWTREGWLYLAVILDLHSRRVIGWAVSNRMKRDLAIRALKMAIAFRAPLKGCVFHSDRGSQYCSHDYQKILRKLPELLNAGGQVLACVNDPDIGADFLIQSMAAEAPQLRFEQRLENPPEFPDISPESGLKALLFSA